MASPAAAPDAPDARVPKERALAGGGTDDDRLDSVRVTPHSVLIRNYYFPAFWVEKEIPLEDVDRVEIVACDPGTSKSWGANLRPVWWNLDMFREFSGKPGLVIYHGAAKHGEHTYFRPAAGVSPRDVPGLAAAIVRAVAATGREVVVAGAVPGA